MMWMADGPSAHPFRFVPPPTHMDLVESRGHIASEEASAVKLSR